MFSLLLLWIVLENLVLRQQLAVLKRRHPRPSLGLFDKPFWVIARRVWSAWSAWKQHLIMVTPDGYTRNRRPLASDRFSYVLEADLQSSGAGWKKTDAEGCSQADLSDGR